MRATLRLKELMTERGMKLSELSRKTSIHPSNLRKYVNNTQMQYSSTALLSLARAFNVPIGALFNSIEEKIEEKT